MLAKRDNANLEQQIIQFLYHEAYLLDNNLFDDWLALFSEDAIYWLPSQIQQQDALETASIIHDDINLLRMRVQRLQHPRAHALQSRPRVLRTVSNITLLSNQDDLIDVRSALLAVEHRNNEQRLFAAHVEHRLRHSDQHLSIACKRVELINCDSVHESISILF